MYIVSFFGHKNIFDYNEVINKLEPVIKDLIRKQSCVDFLVSRNGDFDKIASSTVYRIIRQSNAKNCFLSLVLPYMTDEYKNNLHRLYEYYDNIGILHTENNFGLNPSMQICHKNMIDRSDLIICFTEREDIFTYSLMQYANRKNKSVINLALKK